MKIICTTILLLVFNFGFGQSLQDELEKEICNCFEQQESSFYKSRNLDILDQCFDKPIQKFEKKFEEEIAKKIDTTAHNAYELGMEYGRKLFSDMQEGLIFKCDSYYEIMKSMGKIMLTNAGNGVTEKKLDSISLLVKNNKLDDKLLWERGAYNLGLKKIDRAQEDFIQCIKLNPENVFAKFYLGWTYDLQNNYELAIKYYEESINSSADIGYFSELGRINLAVLKRKQKEE